MSHHGPVGDHNQTQAPDDGSAVLLTAMLLIGWCFTLCAVVALLLSVMAVFPDEVKRHSFHLGLLFLEIGVINYVGHVTLEPFRRKIDRNR